VRRTQAGEFILLNKHLVRDLQRLDLWTPEVIKKLVKEKGSVQNIAEIPVPIRELYRTVWEIPMKDQIDMSADRGAFICQTQSFNVHMSNAPADKLTKMHFYGWKKGLKTGMYYLRTSPAADPIQFTVDPKTGDQELKIVRPEEPAKQQLPLPPPAPSIGGKLPTILEESSGSSDSSSGSYCTMESGCVSCHG